MNDKINVTTGTVARFVASGHVIVEAVCTVDETEQTVNGRKVDEETLRVIVDTIMDGDSIVDVPAQLSDARLVPVLRWPRVSSVPECERAIAAVRDARGTICAPGLRATDVARINGRVDNMLSELAERIAYLRDAEEREKRRQAEDEERFARQAKAEEVQRERRRWAGVDEAIDKMAKERATAALARASLVRKATKEVFRAKEGELLARLRRMGMSPSLAAEAANEILSQCKWQKIKRALP